MREIAGHKVNGCNEALTIQVQDEPGSGGACHEYLITYDNGSPIRYLRKEEVQIRFQNGPIKEVGTNGITHEALLAILIDRFQGFQQGPYRCEANAEALGHLLHAQAALQARTMARVARGVEGTHEV